MNGVREFNRLQGIDLKSYQCETIFVDRPRSGLDSETEKMVQAYPRIFCTSPVTRKRYERIWKHQARRTRLNVWLCLISSPTRTIWSAAITDREVKPMPDGQHPA